MGKASDEGYQTHSYWVPKPSASSLHDSVWSQPFSGVCTHQATGIGALRTVASPGNPQEVDPELAGSFLEIGGWLSLVEVGDRSPGQLSGKPWESLLP